MQRLRPAVPHLGPHRRAAADITVDDCIEAARAQQQYHHKNHTHWYPLLRQAGILPEASPPSMQAVTRRGQLSVAELADAQHVECGPVRELFIDYLSERVPGLDCSSIVALVSKLIRLFRRDLEIHEPGITSLNLRGSAAVLAGIAIGALTVPANDAAASRAGENAADQFAVQTGYGDDVSELLSNTGTANSIHPRVLTRHLRPARRVQRLQLTSESPPRSV